MHLLSILPIALLPALSFCITIPVTRITDATLGTVRHSLTLTVVTISTTKTKHTTTLSEPTGGGGCLLFDCLKKRAPILIEPTLKTLTVFAPTTRLTPIYTPTRITKTIPTGPGVPPIYPPPIEERSPDDIVKPGHGTKEKRQHCIHTVGSHVWCYSDGDGGGRLHKKRQGNIERQMSPPPDIVKPGHKERQLSPPQPIVKPGHKERQLTPPQNIVKPGHKE